MRVVWTFALVAFVSARAPVWAADAIKGCFQKNYEKTYLKKVEKQFITAIQLDVKKGEEASDRSTVEGKLRARFRDDKEKWWEGQFVCMDNGPSWACSMECEGGTFILSPGKKGLQLANQSFLRFHEDETCESKPRDIRADTEHTIFIMPQITSKACKK
jgi:hypothetical protein